MRTLNQKRVVVKRHRKLRTSTLRSDFQNNQAIAASLDIDKILARIPEDDTLIVGEKGVIMNLDYNNPKHMKWMED